MKVEIEIVRESLVENTFFQGGVHPEIFPGNHFFTQ